MQSEITLTAKADLKDNQLREAFTIMERKIDNMNQRTKIHTIKIKALEKQLKEIKDPRTIKSINLKHD